MRHLQAIVIVVLAIFITLSFAGDPLSDAQWESDLDTLAEGLLSRHPNFYTKTSVEDFETTLDEVYERVGTIDDQLMAMEISRLVALGGDAHTNVGFGSIGTGMRTPMWVSVRSELGCAGSPSDRW